MDHKTWSRFEAVPLSNGIITRRTGFDYLKPPAEINAYYRENFGLYWFNELPKTDNVYSPSSQFYGCTLAPGIPLIPNLCRRPLRSPGDGGYDYTTTRTTMSYTCYSDDEGMKEDTYAEHNNLINKMLDNGHSDYNNTHLNNLNLPLPRRRIEFNDSGLDSDSEYDSYDNHNHVKVQSRSDNHVTWFSWIVTVVTTIVTTVVTTVTETLQLRSEKNYNHVDTRVPLKKAVDVSWYQYPVLWLYKAALAVHRADVWLLWKVNSLLQVDRWGTSQQRRKWALVLLLIPILIWAVYMIYQWLLEEESSPVLESAAVWLSSPFVYLWEGLSVLAAWSTASMYSLLAWFDGSWVSYPWIAVAGWWERSADHSSTEEEEIGEAWDVDLSWMTSWISWPLDGLSVLITSVGSFLGSAASALGEGAAMMYTSIVSFLSAVLFWIVDFVTGIPALVTSGFAVIVSPLKSISWPASPPTPDYTPSAPPYEYEASQPQYYQPPRPASPANWDHLLADEQLLAALVRRMRATAEFEHTIAEIQSSNQAKVDSAFSATLDKLDTEVNKVKAELKDKMSVEESSVESKVEGLKQQIQDLQMTLKALMSEQAALGPKLDEKLSLEQRNINEEQVIILLKEQILLEMAKVKEEMDEKVMNIEINQKVVSETSPDSSPPVAPSSELEAFVNATVERLLAIYDADKIAKVDYALASSGGSVLSVRCTETFSLKNAQYNIWGYPLWSKSGNDPRVALEPDIVPGQCWAFSGSQGYLIVELSQNITVTGFTLEHLPKALSHTGTIDTAPRDFRVLGLESEQDDMPILLGRFTYLDNDKSLQYFEALEVDHTFKIVELVIESNHGNLDYTCLYRFRVHGQPVRTP